MRIAMFTDSYYPYLSGVVRSVETFTQELTRLGHQVFIFAPLYPGVKTEPGIFRFFSLPAPTKAGFSLAVPFSPGLGRFLRQLNVDIIHCHSPFLLGQAGNWWGRRLGLPVVFTYHTLYDQYVHYVPLPSFVTRPLVVSWARAFCNSCQLVVAPTPIVKARLQAQGVKTPVLAIPTGIDLEEFTDPEPKWLRAGLRLAPETKIVLSVARFSREKNLGFLLRTFARIRQLYPQVHLVLVGIGSPAGLARLARRLGVAAAVTLVGRKLPRAELAKYYAGSDVFLYTSVTETQGIIIGEAQAAGLPVVAVKAFGVGDMVGDGVDGWLTSLEAEALAARVAGLLQNEALRLEMGQRAKQSARKIAADRMAGELAAAYGRLLRPEGC
ncbi:MAG: glycosyltransferase family 4 protein [Clostridia bacterium]|nr:MAG: glycosyltransferase family 4 protein [Clostridia bacterium]